MPMGTEIIGYADDIAVLCTSEIAFIIEESLEEAFTRIHDWLSTHGLRIAAEKSEALVFTRRRVRNEITVNCAGHAITSQPSIKYLGVQLDKKLAFVEHAELSTARAAAAARQLGHLMPNLRGPRQKSRRLLASVVTSRILYAAPIWVNHMEERAWNKLRSVHRRSQLRVACGYRTISYAAAAVISSIPPVRLLARERADIRSGLNKETAMNTLFNNWQNDWDISTDGRWTYRLIPNVRRWVSRKFGEVTYHLTQVLSGHGCFAAYLNRFGIQESIVCEQCGAAPDDAEHGVFYCDAWANWRRMACIELGITELTPDNLVDIMMSSADGWAMVSDLIGRIMSTRESEERIRQRIPVDTP
jgi:hypothetical protein